MSKKISVEFDLIVMGEGSSRISAVEFRVHNLSDNRSEYFVPILIVAPTHYEEEKQLLASAHEILLDRVRLLLEELQKGPPTHDDDRS